MKAISYLPAWGAVMGSEVGGISEKTAIGRAGAYRPHIETDILLLSTCVARGKEFFTHGERPLPLLSPGLPLSCNRKLLQSSWTGRSFRYAWQGGGLDLHLRTTLPGPLFARFGAKLDLTFAFGTAPGCATDLESGKNFRRLQHLRPGRIVFLSGGKMPQLLVASRPIHDLTVVSWEHLTLSFAGPGARVIWVPLLSESDIPRSRAKQEMWLNLIAAPPIACEESYRSGKNTVIIRQSFRSTGGKKPLVVPLPPLAALLGSKGGLQKMPRATTLLKTLTGPYAVVKGSAFTRTLGACRSTEV